jgi:cysteinyl-tRNA synthetase
MAFVVYNTLTKEKEPFRSLEPGVVRMYNCGPTVYSRPHIGNFRTFLFSDVLRRWLEYRGFEVRQVMNITDVGHLTDDERGEGEDKIEARARREKLDPWQISGAIAAQFLQDIADLGFERALAYPRATDHIPEMLEMIDALVAKGYAYRVGGDVYFEVAKFPRYGRLSGNRVEDLEAGARIEVREEKRHPADFALWKSDPKHLMKWATHYGPDGFPGWHIECSAMAKKHLGDRIDIHTGGEDNIFPHHESEIAQTEAFTGQPFATYWMHAKFLQVDGGKMSKRLGNVYTLDDVRAKGFEPRALRFALIRGHYRQPLNFTWAAMSDAKSALENLDDLVVRLRRAAKGEGAHADAKAGLDLVERARATFEEGMDDDLNISRALPALFQLRGDALEGRLGRAAAASALDFVKRANGVLGCIRVEEELLDADVERLIAERQAARKAKDFARADTIRDELLAKGIALEDTPKGVIWKRVGP